VPTKAYTCVQVVDGMANDMYHLGVVIKPLGGVSVHGNRKRGPRYVNDATFCTCAGVVDVLERHVLVQTLLEKSSITLHPAQTATRLHGSEKVEEEEEERKKERKKERKEQRTKERTKESKKGK